MSGVGPTADDDRAAVDRLIDEHFRAEEAEDVDAIAATFTEDAEHDGDSTQQLSSRRSACRSRAAAGRSGSGSCTSSSSGTA